VVVVDEAARFAISMLGGHDAGANLLARQVAEILAAQAVITTASDSLSLPAADLIGRSLGWKIERAENLTRVAAAIVRREPVAVWQDAGSPAWWQPFGTWPEHFTWLKTWEEWFAGEFSALLAISDRALPPGLREDSPILVYRPPTLVGGIGCQRGTSQETIEAFVAQVFAARELATGSLAAVATVTLKADEPGLIAFAEKRGIPLISFTAEELAEQPGVETPSERVRAKIGIPAVAEPAALRASGSERLLVPKQKGPGMTLALARRPQP
jgi:cobalt-precorrin 5A hydrolase